MSKELIIMVGIPGSGKSTLAKKSAKAREPRSLYVSRDEIREKSNNNENLCFSSFVQSIAKGINEQMSFVYCDATHLTIGSRKKLLKAICENSNLEKLKEYTLSFWVMQTPISICFKRNSQRVGSALVPENVMIKFSKIYKEPILEEFNLYKNIFNNIKITYYKSDEEVE